MKIYNLPGTPIWKFALLIAVINLLYGTWLFQHQNFKDDLEGQTKLAISEQNISHCDKLTDFTPSGLNLSAQCKFMFAINTNSEAACMELTFTQATECYTQIAINLKSSDVCSHLEIYLNSLSNKLNPAKPKEIEQYILNCFDGIN